jgi:TolB-like protein/Flp pilus assembly protein TadD
VWFDQSELRGGDAWDTAIRKQIKGCGLFIPVISQNTHARGEGYFRLEWKLAIDRSHLISSDLPFLLPVAIDDTRDDDERTPERFRELQWTRLPGGETPPAFVDRVARLLSPVAGEAPASDRVPTRSPSIALSPAATVAPGKGWRLAPLLIAAVALLAVGYFAWDKFVLSKHPAATLPSASVTNAIPEQSIAVLPFTDMSEKKDQEYFSDGLTEQMIELLGQVPDLRVPARTSSFYFKGKNEPIASMAQQLKVAHVLEGSVRKAGKRLRITAQLIRADSGYRLWSQTFDRDDKDIFAVQDEIAQAVVSALKLKLAAGAQVTGSRGTTNTEAYNQYLLGRQLDRRGTLEGYRHAVEAYRKAIALDPNYAAAYAELALSETFIGDLTGDTQGGLERAGEVADKAIALAPNDATGYSARSVLRSGWLWDWSGAQADIEKALSLDPHNSDVQHRYAALLDSHGRLPEAIAALKKATELDPLSAGSWSDLGLYYTEAGNYAAADAALGRAIELAPTHAYALYNLATLRLLQGQAQKAIKVAQKIDLAAFRLTVIAMAEHTLGHAKESQLALDELIAKDAQDAAYQIAEVYAWRGEKDKAFAWLERAYQQRDGGLSYTKVDPMLKSLRADPRFNAMLRKMKLPE